jgi:hypothetical protein
VAHQVERFFGLIAHDRIRCGVFTSVPEVEAAIHDYLDHHNAHPKPFVWTKSAEEILAKVSRARHTLETVAQGNQVINSVRSHGVSADHSPRAHDDQAYLARRRRVHERARSSNQST